MPGALKGNKGVGNLWGAVLRIYADGGGLKAFWVGNGLNVTKILPVSAALMAWLADYHCVCHRVHAPAPASLP
jgi:hypothetical protein